MLEHIRTVGVLLHERNRGCIYCYRLNIGFHEFMEAKINLQSSLKYEVL